MIKKLFLISIFLVLTAFIFCNALSGYIPQIVEINRFEFYTNVPNVKFIIDFSTNIISIIKI